MKRKSCSALAATRSASAACSLIPNFPRRLCHINVVVALYLCGLFSVATSFANNGISVLHLPKLQRRQEQARISTFSLIHSPCRQHNLLFSTVQNNDDDDKDNDGSRRPFLLRVVQRVLSAVSLRRLVVRLRGRVQVFRSRFQLLSRRAQRLVVTYFVVLVLSLGGMTRQVLHHHYENKPTSYHSRLMRPREIPYSRFLDYIEESQHLPKSNSDSSVRIDGLQIGPERITYKLYSAQAANSESNTNTIAPTPLPTMKSDRLKSVLGRLRQKLPTTLSLQRQPPSESTTQVFQQSSSGDSLPFVFAYTRHLPSNALIAGSAASTGLMPLLRQHGISFTAAPPPPKRTTASLLATSARTLIVTLYGLFLWRLYKNMLGGGGGGGGGGGALGSGKDTPGKLAGKKTRQRRSEEKTTTFDDIQGIDEAKFEVMELVDTLRHPEKYKILGARAPTGLLLEGPPGTGKTLLARATAAAAGVPLLYCSGSDFVEVFVGRGAARIRSLFERAEKMAPCIIFIDELDALGKARDGVFGNNNFGGAGRNDEAEQTINQLLACMDGLDSSKQVIVLAATNRKDVLDPALVRPGRFDRMVRLNLPNAAGREAILRVHCRKLPGFVEGSGVDLDRINALGVLPNRQNSSGHIDLSALAIVTEGWSGAELELIVNEAAIRAVRRVSAALRKQSTANSTNISSTMIQNADEEIVPHVTALDFEVSLQHFMETRRPRNTNTVSELLKRAWNQ